MHSGASSVSNVSCSALEEHKAQLMASLDVDDLMEKGLVQFLPDTRGYLVWFCFRLSP